MTADVKARFFRSKEHYEHNERNMNKGPELPPTEAQDDGSVLCYKYSAIRVRKRRMRRGRGSKVCLTQEQANTLVAVNGGVGCAYFCPSKLGHWHFSSGGAITLTD